MQVLHRTCMFTYVHGRATEHQTSNVHVCSSPYDSTSTPLGACPTAYRMPALFWVVDPCPRVVAVFLILYMSALVKSPLGGEDASINCKRSSVSALDVV